MQLGLLFMGKMIYSQEFVSLRMTKEKGIFFFHVPYFIFILFLFYLFSSIELFVALKQDKMNQGIISIFKQTQEVTFKGKHAAACISFFLFN